MRAPLVLMVLFSALAACSKEEAKPAAQGSAPLTAPTPAAPPPIGGGGARAEPGGAPRAPAVALAADPSRAQAPSAHGAAAPPLAPPPPQGPSCEGLVSRVMLDAITGMQTQVAAMPEPSYPGKSVTRCEHRSADIEHHFGYYLECGRAARRTYAALHKRMRRMARKRKGPWRSAFEAPGSFAFLAEGGRCFGQIAGRFLLRRVDVGERIAAEIARSIR